MKDRATATNRVTWKTVEGFPVHPLRRRYEINNHPENLSHPKKQHRHLTPHPLAAVRRRGLLARLTDF
jgi:hypothetical protein